MDPLNIIFYFTAIQRGYPKIVRYEEPIHKAVYDLIKNTQELSDLIIRGLSAKGRRVEMSNNYVTEKIEDGTVILVESDVSRVSGSNSAVEKASTRAASYVGSSSINENYNIKCKGKLSGVFSSGIIYIQESHMKSQYILYVDV